MKTQPHSGSWTRMSELCSTTVWKRAVFKRGDSRTQTLAFWSGVALLGSATMAQGVSTNFQAEVLADAPILYYQFHEVAGAATNHGSLGPAFDATYFGTPQHGAATSAGDAGVRFDSADDYLESASIAPSLLSGNPTFTAEAIFFIPANGTAALWPPFLHWGVSAAAPTMKSVYFSFSRNDPTRIFAGFYNGGLRTVNPVPRGQWHHVVWVRQGGGAANVGTTVYIDGVSVTLENDPALCCNGQTPTVTNAVFRVNRAQDFNRFFTGTLDEVALYDRALTASDVQRHFQAFVVPSPLTIVRTAPGQATISWTIPSLVLQESASLSPVDWTNSPSGATNPIVVPATLPMKYYRLIRP